MKQRIVAALVVISILIPRPVSADMFGGDVAVLVQILANAVKQLTELKQIVDAGNGQLNLLREINRGINDSLFLYQTLFPNADPGVYQDWAKIQQAVKGVEDIYGIVVASKDQKLLQNNDRSVAEAISLNNSIYDYSKSIDEIGENIKNFTHQVSPGGAQKLTAQTLGVLLQVVNQSLRTQATGLKLQAQTLALQNHEKKENTKFLIGSSQTLSTAMKQQNPRFTVPRF